MESIEKIKIFRRQEERWVKRQNVFKRIFYVITNPSRAFWDIKNEVDGKGPILIIFFNAIILGLWALATKAAITVNAHLGVPNTLDIYFVDLLNNLAIFLMFFIFGIVYFWFMFFLWNLLFTLGANISVNLSQTIKIRYGEQKEEEEKEMFSAEKAKKKDEEEKLNPRKAGKGKMMMYAYAPTIVINLICTVLILVGLLTTPITIADTTPYNYNPMALIAFTEVMFDNPVWAIVEVLQIVTLVGWIPITMSIALRDLSNSSTVRLYIACVVIGALTSYMIIFLRPTLNWNFNIIAGQT
jgi:hypothetical protein